MEDGTALRYEPHGTLDVKLIPSGARRAVKAMWPNGGEAAGGELEQWDARPKRTMDGTTSKEKRYDALRAEATFDMWCVPANECIALAVQSIGRAYS